MKRNKNCAEGLELETGKRALWEIGKEPIRPLAKVGYPSRYKQHVAYHPVNVPAYP